MAKPSYDLNIKTFCELLFKVISDHLYWCDHHIRTAGCSGRRCRCRLPILFSFLLLQNKEAQLPKHKQGWNLKEHKLEGSMRVNRQLDLTQIPGRLRTLFPKADQGQHQCHNQSPPRISPMVTSSVRQLGTFEMFTKNKKTKNKKTGKMQLPGFDTTALLQLLQLFGHFLHNVQSCNSH